jgi:hypothetical protein
MLWPDISFAYMILYEKRQNVQVQREHLFLFHSHLIPGVLPKEQSSQPLRSFKNMNYCTARCVILHYNADNRICPEDLENDPRAEFGTNPYIAFLPDTLSALQEQGSNPDEDNVYSLDQFKNTLFKEFVPREVSRQGKTLNIRVSRPGKLGWACINDQSGWVKILSLFYNWDTMPKAITGGSLWSCLEIYCDISLPDIGDARGGGSSSLRLPVVTVTAKKGGKAVSDNAINALFNSFTHTHAEEGGRSRILVIRRSGGKKKEECEQ